jgi:hypothetical protein
MPVHHLRQWHCQRRHLCRKEARRWQKNQSYGGRGDA